MARRTTTSVFANVNAVLLTVDSAGVSGYCISAPEQAHLDNCAVVLATEEDDEIEEADLHLCKECGSALTEEEIGEVRVPVCGCRVTGYELVEAGLARTQADRQAAVERAVEVANDLGVPLVVVREDWTPHGMSTAAFKSLLVTWGKWEAELEQAGVPSEFIFPVLANTWHGALFGSAIGVRRSQRKARACSFVCNVLKMPPMSEDISEALCIRVWGQHAASVHAVVEAFFKEAA